MTQLKDFHQQFAIDTDETVYSNEFDLSNEVIQQVSVTAVVSSRTAGAVLITPQRSFDGDNWADVDTAFSSISANGTSNTTVDECQPLLRFKIVSSGSADMTLDIYAIVSESAGDGGGVSGGATLAEQETQTGVLGDIETAIENTPLKYNKFNGVGYDLTPASETNPLPTVNRQVDENGNPVMVGWYSDQPAQVKDASADSFTQFLVGGASYGTSLVGDVTGLSKLADLSLVLSNFETSGIYYFQVFDTASTPSSGATPLFELPVAPASTADRPSQYSLSVELRGLKFSAGMTFGISSARGSYTGATKNVSIAGCYREVETTEYAP